MKNLYMKFLRQSSRAIMLVMLTAFMAFAASAQTITINSVTPAPYYTFGVIDVDYTAAGYPAGTTFYLMVDTNSNGFLDEEDDNEDVVIASSTSLTGVLSGNIPDMTGNLDFYIVAGEDGTFGEVVSQFSETAANLTTSGTVSAGYPLLMDQDMTERSIETPDYDLTSDDFYILVLDVDATNVVPANDLLVEVSEDNGTTYAPLTDQQGNASFSASNGELIFAISQSLNTSSVRFRVIQNNSAGIAAATETWSLSSIDLIEYGGTFVQYNEEFAGTLFINSPTFTINSEVYDNFIGEDVEVDYTGLGFTTVATFYLYNGDILDPDNRTIFDSNTITSTLFSGTWPLELGDQNVDVRISGIYGNIDEPLMEFDNSDLTILGSSSTAYNYEFSSEGVRSATTDLLDLSGEDYVTLSVTVDPNGTFSTDNAVLVQYSIDDTNWIDLEDDNGVDEITNTAPTTYEYTLPNAAKTASTRIRVRQKAIDLTAFSSFWYLNDMRIAFYTVGADQFVNSPFVSNYSVTVSMIEDADDNVISGGTVYPGDEITVTGDALGFDVNTEDYTVLINNTFLLDNEVVSIDGVTDEIVITGNIPTDVEYANASDIQIKIYDGTEPLVAINENIFADYNEEEDITVVGDDLVEDGDTKVEFTLAGDRSLTTPEFHITSTDDLALTFTLNRTNPVRSPSGTEVVVEFSTDGTTFTEIETFSINSAGEAGETYELDNTTLPAGMASASTSVRFRQASNNGLNLDAWELQNITLMGGTNVSDPGYINYNGLTLDILAPAITLTAIDNANLDLYPTTDFDAEFEVVGEFPAGTTYDLWLVRPLAGSISLGTFTAGGTQSVTVPAVVADTYDLVIEASHEETESNTVELVVGEVTVANVTITSTDAVTDGTDMIVYPGNDIDIAYDVVGVLGSSAVMNLEIYDNETDEYMMIVEGEDVDGTISATLPLGIDYDANDAAFRLTVTNGNLSGFASYSQIWNNTTSISELYFPLELREGHQSSNYWYNNSTERSATSIPLNFASGGEVTLNLRLFSTFYYASDQEVRLEYSLDEGDTWVEFETATLINSTADIFPADIEIPEEAWQDDVLIRWITNEDGQVSGTENWLYFYGFEVENFELFAIAEEEFTLQPDLILEELSVSQSTLEDNDFILGEEFVVEYNAEGPFPSDVEFAIVMEQGGQYVTLAETDQTGAVQATVNIPAFPFEDTDMPYNLEVIPFVKVGASDVFRAAAETETVMEEEDILVVEGRSPFSTGYSDFEFDQAGDRSLLTRAFDLADFGSARLDFSFTWYDGDFTTLLTLPELQVSIDDGATFETLEVTDAMFEAEGLVYPTGAYSVEIPETYLTAATHFRWIQKLNLGEDEDDWRVYNIDVVKGETNELNDQIYTTFNNPQSINVMVPSIANYIWEPSDLSDAVFSGETFNYNWDFNSLVLDESDFPAGTEYVFTIDEEDPETGENIVIATTSMLGADQEASIPSYVSNGTYNVLLTASITDGDEEYFLFEDEDVADLDVFLKAITTNYLGVENDVIYAGSTVSFGITVENDETNAVGVDDLFANLVVKNFDGSDELILATQSGVADITVDLPPHLNGTHDFEIRLSENAALGSVGDLIDVDASENGETLIPGDFISGDFVTLVETNDFYEYFFPGQDVNRNLEFDYEIDAVLAESEVANERLRFQYSTDGGNNWNTYTSWSSTSGSYAVNLNNFMTNGFNVPSGSSWERVRFRWIAYDPWTWPYGPQARGSQIEISNVDIVGWSSNLENSTSYFPNGGSTSGPNFSDDIGRGLITTRDLLPEELESATLVSFDFSFGELLEDIGADQAVVFEYSTDGGATYTELDVIPSQTLYDDEFDGVPTVLDEENFVFPITTDMQTEGARFRFRQEERNGIEVGIFNFEILFGSQLPFDYISSEQAISPQAILVTGISSIEGCLEDDIVIDYEIRGRMGGENIVTARYEDVDDNGNADDFSVELNATSGSGQITVKLPSEVFDDDENNKHFRFGLAYDDDTDDDYNFSGVGALSEAQMEVVAPIDEGANFSVNSGNNLECEGEDVTVNVSSPRDHFMYEILNEADGSVLGSLSYDPEDPESKINLGVIAEDATLQMRVTSFSSGGLECNTLTSSVTRDVDLLANYELNVNDNGSGYVPVEAGDGKSICVDASANATLRVYRPDGSLATSGVEWFRDDLNNPVSVGTSYQVVNSEMSEAGSYFARVTDGSCSYLTESYVITNIPTPDLVEITILSGDLGICDGDGEVVLEATAGFTYYSWSTGETTQSITIDEEGNYSVTVSNVPFEVGCTVTSEVLELETTYSQEFTIRSSAQGAFLLGGETVNDCDATTIQFYDEEYNFNQNANGGLYTVFRDGAPYKTTTGSSISIDQSGAYTIEWTNDALNGVCTTNSPTFNVVIFESIEDAPAITVVSGDLLFCEGDGEVVLSAPAGFSFYEWSGGNVDGSGAQTVTVTEGDTYTVRVSNLPFGEGCASPDSPPVVVREASSPEFFVRTDTDGFDENNIIDAGTVLEECDSETIYFFENNSWANNGTVVLFRDGAEYAQIFERSFEITESGTYTAEKRSDDINISCVRNIGDFTVTINEAPTAVPMLTSTGALEFCTNEGNSVLLTAPAGFTVYNWFRNGGSISANTAGFNATSNTLEVIESGTYSVQVGNVAGCYSPVSNIIEVTTRNLPNIPGVSQQDATCGPGTVTFSFNGDNLYSYQLINAMTGQPSGNPVVGGDSFNSYITSESISEETPFYLEVSYADGSGCTTFNEFSTFTGEPNNVNLELDGNTLEAVISDYSGRSEIRWYRNGTELKNRVNNTSINITDAATYSVEVDFEGVGLCTVTSNSIDLGSEPTGRGRQSDTSIDAKTYPNPVVSNVNIEIEDQSVGMFEVKIMTLSGQVVLEDSFENELGDEAHTIAVGGLQSGIYTLTIRQGTRVTSKRLFIQ